MGRYPKKEEGEDRTIVSHASYMGENGQNINLIGGGNI
jgi:hypothetical protein